MRIGRRKIHRLFGAEDLCALAHKRYAAKDNDGLIAFYGALRQGKAVAHEVRCRLHGVGCIVVRKDKRVPAIGSACIF